MQPLLTTLRTTTRPLHEQLDSRELSQKVIQQRISAPEYTQLIRWQHRAHLVAEVGLTEYEWPKSYQYTSRLEALQDEAIDLFPAPIKDVLTYPASLAEAVGRAYVLAGSALGGNMILGHLNANSAVSQFAPFPFYQYQRNRGLAEWRSFLAFVNSHSWTEDELHVATAAAKEVFGVFARTA